MKKLAYFISVIFFSLAISISQPTDSIKAQSLSHFLHFPIVAKPVEKAQPSCLPNAQEAAIATLMKSSSGQGRASLTCNPILAKVARERALDLGQRSYFNHTNPDGVGPNYLVTQAGYVLPSFYGNGLADNYIESIAAGYSTTSETWSQWMGSSGHKQHILGEISFYADQVEYGIGYASVPGSPYIHYWVILTAQPGP